MPNLERHRQNVYGYIGGPHTPAMGYAAAPSDRKHSVRQSEPDTTKADAPAMTRQAYLDLVYRAKGVAGEAAFNETYKRTGCGELARIAQAGARRGVREALL